MYYLRLLLVLLALLCQQQWLHAQKGRFLSDTLSTAMPSSTNSCYQKAEVLRQDGKIITARPYYKQAIDTSILQKHWEVYLLSSAHLGESYIGSFNYHEGIAIVVAALERLQQLSHIQPELGFQLYSCLARLYRYAQEHQKSVGICVKALRYLRKTTDTKLPNIYTKAYIQLGMSYAANAQWEQALQFYQKAEGLLAHLPHKEVNQLRPLIYALYGSYYAQMWDFVPATQYLEQALEAAMHHQVTNSPEVFSLYQDIAKVYQRLGENEKSIAHFKKAAYLIETSNLESHLVRYTQLPMIYLGIAKNFCSMQQPKEALFYCRKVKAIAAKRKENVAPYVRTCTQVQLARIHTVMGQFERAATLLKKAKTFYPKQYAPGYRPMLDKLSHQIDLAVALLSKEQKDFERAKGLYHSLSTQIQGQPEKKQIEQLELNFHILTHLAEIHEDIGNQDSAFHYNQLALISSCQLFNDPDPSALPNAQACANAPKIFQILQQKANLFQRAARITSVRRKKLSLLENGLRTIHLLDEVYTENLKKANILRDGQTKTLMHQRQVAFQTGIELAIEHHQVSGEPASLQKSFYYAEKMKAQQLSLHWIKHEAINYEEMNQAIIQKEHDLLEDIVRFEKMIEEASFQNDTAEATRLEHDLLFCKQKEYAAFQRDLEEQYPQYNESKYSFLTEETSSLPDILEPRELLINYVFADSQLLIFTLTQESSLTFTQTPIDHSLSQDLANIHGMLKGSSMMRRKSRERFILLAHKLYQQLIGPIQDQLAGKSKLVIIGDGMTNYLPFEVLLKTPSLQAFHQLDFLIKSYEISYHYSASLLAKARKKQIKQKKGIFAFAPVYGKSESVANQAEGNAMGVARAGGFLEELAPLPESQHEVLNIIKVLGVQGQQDNTLALRYMANEFILKRHLRDDYTFIHIAGHSFANLVNPNFSGIACYEDYFGNEDGILYAGEIYHLDIKADLVSLSSCESGYGKLERNEGMLGLNHAFISAGAPNVVFSLWKIYDKVSAQLMVDFYQKVLEDKNYAASLREAKLRLLKNPVTAAPHYWSPYLLIGR